jgi:predicted nucleic acid-binding protein
MRVALDSNILAYLAGVSRNAADDHKIAVVRSLLRQINESASLIAPLQALGELFVVLRRSGLASDEARQIVLEFTETLASAPSTERTMLAALDLVVDHKLQFWDSLIISVAAEAGCGLLLSEDMQHGFVVRGMTVVNPLAPKPHPKLKAILQG